MAKEKDKVEVEIEAGGRELEIEIDPETGETTVEKGEPEAEDVDAGSSGDSEAPTRPGKKRGRLLLGLLAGGLAGAASASAIVRQLAGEPSNGAQEPQGGPEAASGGLIGSLQARWREATHEGRSAAREAEKKAMARYRELTGDD